jgi:hypothetical protein
MFKLLLLSIVVAVDSSLLVRFIESFGDKFLTCTYDGLAYLETSENFQPININLKVPFQDYKLIERLGDEDVNIIKSSKISTSSDSLNIFMTYSICALCGCNDHGGYCRAPDRCQINNRTLSYGFYRYLLKVCTLSDDSYIEVNIKSEYNMYRDTGYNKKINLKQGCHKIIVNNQAEYIGIHANCVGYNYPFYGKIIGSVPNINVTVFKYGVGYLVKNFNDQKDTVCQRS